jgi:putative molybdopterin biosynthesis protein
MKQEQFLHVVDRDEAETSFRAALGDLSPRRTEVVALDEALGRVLAEDVCSPVDVPGFDRANVDGFAVRAQDTFGASEFAPRKLRLLAARVAMGAAPSVAVGPGDAMAIPTGGVIPRGADAIVMVEHTAMEGDALVVTKALTPGRNISFAGIDVAQGETVLRARDVLTSRETGVLAAMGIARVSVIAQPRVAILSTGDEIVAPGAAIAVGQIYDANATIVGDAVREQGGTVIPLGVVGDDLEAVKAALARGLAAADVVLLSGGTSKGPGDLNVRALEAIVGPSGIVVHGVALKPGKPICLAVSGGKPVVVLPGFPASAIFTFHEFVAPVIRKLAGRDDQDVGRVAARVPYAISSEIGRTEYVLVHLVEDDAGALVAYPIGKGSGSITAWTQADGYFVIPRAVEQLDAREPVSVLAIAGTRARKDDLVVIGSHCVGLDVILAQLRARGFTAKLIAIGSEGGLRAVQRGECDIAGAHLFDAATGAYNRPFLTPDLDLVRGYGRLQGVVFRPGDERFEGKPAEVAVREAAATPGVVMVNRNRGSGTRAIIDRLLGELRPDGYGVEASSHHAIAAAVSQARADFGVAIDVVARERGLGFTAIAEERYDFFVRRARRDRAAVRAFIEELERPATRAALRARGLVA